MDRRPMLITDDELLAKTKAAVEAMDWSKPATEARCRRLMYEFMRRVAEKEPAR